MNMMKPNFQVGLINVNSALKFAQLVEKKPEEEHCYIQRLKEEIISENKKTKKDKRLFNN